MSNYIISNETKKRLIKDIKEVIKGDISKDGIYYIHDESDMLLGYALIIGPQGTPYEYGNFLFKFKFLNDLTQMDGGAVSLVPSSVTNRKPHE